MTVPAPGLNPGSNNRPPSANSPGGSTEEPPTQGDITDATLLTRYIERRDGPAFAELVRRFGPLVWGVCLRRTGDRQDAEDAFQSAFLLLALKARSIREPAALPGWLYRTAHRTAGRAAQRADATRDGTLDALPEPAADGPGLLAELARREALGAFDEEVLKLPAAERDALILCHLHGLTRSEAAVRLGATEAAIKGRLSRGRSRLRTRLARRGFALPSFAPLLLSDPVPAAAAEAVCRLADPLALSAGAGPLSSLLPHWSEKGLDSMTLLKSRPAAALFAVAASVALMLALQPPHPASAGGGQLAGMGLADAGPADAKPAAAAIQSNPGAARFFNRGSASERNDRAFSAALAATPSVPYPATDQPAGFSQAGAFGVPAAHVAPGNDSADLFVDGTTVPSGEWQRNTSVGPFRLSLRDGHLSLTGEATIEEDQGAPITVEVHAEYAALSDGTLVGVIQSAEGTIEGDLMTNVELAVLGRGLTDQAFALRVYRNGGTFAVKDVSLAVPTGSDVVNAGASAGDWSTMTDVMLVGRWQPVSPAPTQPHTFSAY
ncbi:RNA polymerase sigma factor [Alienimonas chondri]|uniref:Sigma-70 family RNA polymerase sigma factor n=1 Tax=Alienimonas chondri TaxID=2681879 RepID=A0ABX1VKA2_9PLAN|nr:sigma-70 family RNA polymerase sigma factor [Alienimonas chondri]NNJ27587.1 hypothetical protein [Alienimonas chondri]